MIIEQEISELAVGTYVVDIVQQKNKYNLASSGWVNSETVIETLKSKGVQRVLIDTNKQRKPYLAPEDVSTRELPPFQEEITQAQAIFKESKAILRKLFDDVKEGILLDLAPIKKISNESIEVIFKNPDALAFVINLRKKDEYLLEHSVAVSILITIFARHMCIDKEIVRELSIGAFLHDVGKIKLPDEVLNKPGRLTEEEYEIVKSHVTHSIDSIQATPGISDLSLEVAALHHEKLNGQGYPYGLSGEKISTYGRMITICDIFDALTCSRCYKDSYPQVKAFRILQELAEDNQLDSNLVDSFISCMGVYPVGSLVQLDSNKLAIVESRNKKDPIRPKVKVFYNMKNKSFEISKNIDLSVVKDEKIIKCVKADDYNLNMRQIIEFLKNDN